MKVITKGHKYELDSYAWWVGVMIVLMACLIGCVVCGQGMSAIAFAIVIHTSAKIQRWESKDDTNIVV